MFHRLIFKLGNNIKRPGVISNYYRFLETQWLPFEELKEMQERQLSKIIEHAYQNVPYYTKLFNRLGLIPSDVTTIEDLEKLPILTKQNIKQNWQDFIPDNLNKLKYLNSATGGSTGTPLKYRMSIYDYRRGVGLLYRGWGYGGYKPGDKVAVIAGSSLIPTTKSTIYKRMQNIFLNCHLYSSFDMSQQNLFKYFYDINNWKPDIVQGYASSIYLFAKFIEGNNLKLSFQPKAMFTTAEKLFDRQRTLIEQIFCVKVFDNYGLNDGGVSAYECAEHCGMHIDMERAVFEVVDDTGKQGHEREGKILATSLYNYALPFIRYDTGDLGILCASECSCGRKTALLKGISGRIQEFIFTPGGLKIYGEFFTHIFYDIDNVSQFQVIQNSPDEILINIVPDKWDNMAAIDVGRIKEVIASRTTKLEVNIQFKHENELQYTQAGKYKFIINEIVEA